MDAGKVTKIGIELLQKVGHRLVKPGAEKIL
jgi:hypothetical protein